MQTHRSFLEDIVDESIEMTPLAPRVLDTLLADGWRLLGYSVIRHNFAVCRGHICRTIPLRIRLDNGLDFSKSQRRVLRRNANLQLRWAPIEITPEKKDLFLSHAKRFNDRQPMSIHSFLHPEADRVPVTGLELTVFDNSRLIACSYIHIGEHALSGTYCFFDPEYARKSLGTFTMLLELKVALEMGKRYYYHGYCYDVPSEFDYKLNLNNLEAMDWRTGQWLPRERVSG
ncbi:MAG: arginine-tRNA-protein transferase [Saprospiraceae bacterium]